MLSYLSLTNVTQNTLNLIVATTKHFPALKAYVIDIHNDSCKLLVSQACTVDDYYLLDCFQAFYHFEVGFGFRFVFP